MDSIVKAMVKLIPFSTLLEKTGMSADASVSLAAVLNAILIFLVIKIIKMIIDRCKYSKVAQDLSPWFDYQKVKSSRELFIPTKFQNNSPTREEEPSFSHKFVATNELIPFFLKKAFNEKKESDKFYLILADSGMGKTTFMINLYLRYTSFFNFRRKYKIRLFPFGDSRILDKIREIDKKDVSDTILLLDAFDEYREIFPPSEPDGMSDEDRFRSKLDEIIETVRDFREVIITSRTQYFPGQEEQPYELKIPRFDEDGYHILAKFYLSPFEKKEIRSYLRRKYGIFRFWNSKKKRNAASIINSAQRLMVRPMLLSYIDYLTDSNNVFKNTLQIYEALIEKWVEREAKKRKHKTVERDTFKSNLLTYSKLVALEIYNKRKQKDMLFLDKESAVQIAIGHAIDLKDYEITGQSLLTKDVSGNWKFAHKSIFEYFIAQEVIINSKMAADIDFNGMDMALQFYNESNPGFVFIKGGEFLMGTAGNDNEEVQHKVLLDDFYIMKYPVTVEEYVKFKHESNYDHTQAIEVKGNRNHPVVNVSWNDAQAYCEWLSKKRNAKYQLPTEAQWEYACRAGSTDDYCFGNDENRLEDYCWYNKNSEGITHPVGKKNPNKFGLYDMHGNVWEWCMDWYDTDYYKNCLKNRISRNPQGPKKGSGRVFRGGSWDDVAGGCRCAFRYYSLPDDRNDYVGFRVVFLP